MPAHKRSWSENLDDEDSMREELHRPHTKQSRFESEPKNGEGQEGSHRRGEDRDEEDEEDCQKKQGDEEEEEEGEEEGASADSEGRRPSSGSAEKPEFVFVELPDIRKDVQCPICLGIIKKTRTVMECLHRFCRECIDKSMRLGNNECPACRTHCASRRSLRDDPNYDALIAALYPDIDKYEEEELAFHEEERTRNKQIQDSIAQIFQRQSEALTTKKRGLGKETAGTIITTRSQRNNRNAYLRRRSGRGVNQGSDDIEDENDNNGGGKDSSSSDERVTEVRPRKRKKHPGIRSSRPSPGINSDSGCNENDLDANRENRGISPGLVWNSEKLAWGRGGVRSHTRHGGAGGSNSKSSRNTRLTKLVDYLHGLDENNDEFDVHVMLVSLEEESTSKLQQPHLCCRPSLSVKHLRQYLGCKIPSLKAEDVEILVVKRCCSEDDRLLTFNPAVTEDGLNLMNALPIDQSKAELQSLEEKETLAEIRSNCSTSIRDPLILGYRREEKSLT